MVDNDSRRDTLRRRLAIVNERIAEHPLSSEEFTRARAVVAQRTDDGPQAVNAELRAQGVPSLGAQARLIVRRAGSLARLNRKRLRLETRIREAERPRS